MAFELDPDFDKREVFIQPQTRRHRSAYRSPISSEDMNLYHQDAVSDINYLYTKLDAIQAEWQTRVDEFVYLGQYEYQTGETLLSLREYLNELKIIRQEIEGMTDA